MWRLKTEKPEKKESPCFQFQHSKAIGAGRGRKSIYIQEEGLLCTAIVLWEITASQLGSITIFHSYTRTFMQIPFLLSPNLSHHQNTVVWRPTPTKRHIHSSRACRHSGILALRVISPQIEGSQPFSSLFANPGVSIRWGEDPRARSGKPLRRRVERKTGVSRNTSPVWCAACAGSLPRVHAPFENAGSGLLPSRTIQEANAASQSASGFLQERMQICPQKMLFVQTSFVTDLR